MPTLKIKPTQFEIMIQLCSATVATTTALSATFFSISREPTPTFWCDFLWTLSFSLSFSMDLEKNDPNLLMWLRFSCGILLSNVERISYQALIMRICSDQTKLDIERADQKSIHVILRRPPSWKPDGSKGQTPPFPGGDPWRGIVKVINANIEEKMEKKRRAEVFDKSFLVDLGPREDETSARVLN